MGRTSGAPRRAAGFASALLLVAVLVGLLSLVTSPVQRLGEIGLGLAAAVYMLATAPLAARGWLARDLVVVARGVVSAAIGAGMVALAPTHVMGVEIVALMIFSAAQISAPAQARARALVLTTLLVDSVFAATWLAWTMGDVPSMLAAIAFMGGLQLVVLAQAKAAEASTDSNSLRSSAHSAAATRVGTTIDVLGVTRAVLETSRESFPMATGGFVLLYDVVSDRLRPLPVHLTPRGVAQLDVEALDLSLAPGEGLAGKVFAASRPLVWQTTSDVHMAEADVSAAIRDQLNRADTVTRSAIGAPLVTDDEVIGVYLLVSHRQELVWTEEDVPVVTTLADEAARAIERGRRYERELDQAHLDSITGLANHRQLTRTLEQELSRARRRSTTLGVVFCDLDRFKNVNDTFGHSAGDRVLTILSRVFRDLLRREDSAARYGGDEFVCVLPGADHEEAAAVGRRISTSFEQRAREDPELIEAGVTISCGVAIFPDDADTVDGLLQHADAAMRRVKTGNRTTAVEARGTS